MEELKQKLNLHKLWVKTDGKSGERAILSDADLIGADLRSANLRDADLRGANLRDADLIGADLRSANLRDADLIWANLSGANLRGANLSGANLRGANLSGADLIGADLRGAILPESLTYFEKDENLIHKIKDVVLSTPVCLNMKEWHSPCGTAHCLAGWAVELHPDGKRMEAASSTYLAGRLLLGDEIAEKFFDSNEDVLVWLKSI